MNEEQKKFLELAKKNKKVNKKMFIRMARKKNLDNLFHSMHEELFQKIDCLTCANCCRTTSPIWRDVDIDRISKHLNLKPSDFTSKYLHIDEENDWVLNQSPCAFLNLQDNKCAIYDFRPKACREYPHTNRKNMTQILDLTFKNTMVCPAVSEMAEKLRLGGE
ncbi:MAG: YkgJ family cysteine cluster protein [Bacteroidota bacterium]|jgi:Fe-S-cluster containining protein